MDPRRQRYQQYPSAGNAENPMYLASSSTSHPDLLSNQLRPSPLRNNISVSEEESQGYRYHYSASHPAVNAQSYPPQTFTNSHYHNPFSSPTPETSPRHSDYDYEYDSFGQSPYGTHHREMGSYGEYLDQEFSLQPFGGNYGGNYDGEIVSDIRSELPTESNSNTSSRRQKQEFKSYLLNGKYEKPWIEDKRLYRTRINNYIIYFFILASLGVSAYVNYAAIKQTNYDKPYCLVLDDQFSGSKIDGNTWNREVQIGGFGTGSFDWTTNDDRNSFVDSQGLHIVPTLTTDSGISEAQLLDGYTLNLTSTGGDGSCTFQLSANNTMEYIQACSISSNKTLGTIIPPVRSARLNTRHNKSIKYGKVEVVAKLAAGDWLWPAIWMMPENDTYGIWPMSGEIDIMESRGNEYKTYGKGGRDFLLSTMHWGPSSKTDAFWRTTAPRNIRRTDYSKGFHTYGIEWTKDYLFTWVDSPLYQVLYIDFTKENMWSRGSFQNSVENSTLLDNPWQKSPNNNAPFDQKFYLILNLAVGSRNGWFANGVGAKPWVDANDHAAFDFYKAKDKWFPTWGQGGGDAGMTVKRVKMWEEGKCS